MKVKISTTFFIIFLLITFCAYQIHKDSLYKISYGERTLEQFNIVNNLDELILTLQQLETGSRGFVLTSDTNFLQPGQDQLSKINLQLIQLRRLTYNDQNQTGNIEKINEYVQKKIKFALQLTQLVKSNQVQIAKNKIKSIEGRSEMDSIFSYSNKIRTNYKYQISDLPESCY